MSETTPEAVTVVSDDRIRMNCRYYENKFPEVEQVVMVQVKSIAEMGAYCSLLEYNGIEGMILLSELSRRRIRSINKHIRVGRNEAVLVLRVDEEKGYIDLSKRRVSPEDVAKAEEKYQRSKQVHSIVRHTAEVKKKTTEEMCEKVAWPLYKKYGHAYDAFKHAVLDPESVLGGMGLEEDVYEELVQNIKRRLTPQPMKIRADVDVSCFTYEGIDAIKAALMKGQIGDGEEVVKISLVAPPSYVFVCTSLDKKKGIALLEKSVEIVTEALKKDGGTVDVKVAARAVSQRDDDALSKILGELQKANAEVDGDADDNEMEADDDAEE